MGQCPELMDTLLRILLCTRRRQRRTPPDRRCLTPWTSSPLESSHLMNGSNSARSTSLPRLPPWTLTPSLTMEMWISTDLHQGGRVPSNDERVPDCSKEAQSPCSFRGTVRG